MVLLAWCNRFLSIYTHNPDNHRKGKKKSCFQNLKNLNSGWWALNILRWFFSMKIAKQQVIKTKIMTWLSSQSGKTWPVRMCKKEYQRGLHRWHEQQKEHVLNSDDSIGSVQTLQPLEAHVFRFCFWKIILVWLYWFWIGKMVYVSQTWCSSLFSFTITLQSRLRILL